MALMSRASSWKNWERHHKAPFVEKITEVVKKYGM